MGINSISAKRIQVYEAISQFLAKEADIFRKIGHNEGSAEYFFDKHLSNARIAIDGMITHIHNFKEGAEREQEKVKLG